MTLLVLDDPGMPAGMASSGTTCIPRELAASNTSEPAMCKVYIDMYIYIHTYMCMYIYIYVYVYRATPRHGFTNWVVLPWRGT